MSYFHEHYQANNIIGYTGQPADNPTVYFLSEEKSVFGHISQAHTLIDNVGREKARDSTDYTIWNEFVDGAERSVERMKGKIIHRSRSLFVPIEQVPFEDQLLLIPAIHKFTNLKRWCQMSDAEKNAA